MKRRKPLPRQSKPIKRVRRLPASQKPIAPRKKDPKARRWAKHRDPAYCAWIRTLPCTVGGSCCWGLVEAAHVRARSTGGADWGNLTPLCHAHHAYQHRNGMKSFQKAWGVNLTEIALALASRYTQEHE